MPGGAPGTDPDVVSGRAVGAHNDPELTLSPARILCGRALTVARTRAASVGEVAVALLFAALVSGVDELTVAVLVSAARSTAGPPALTARWKTADAPAASAGIVHCSVPLWPTAGAVQVTPDRSPAWPTRMSSPPGAGQTG